MSHPEFLKFEMTHILQLYQNGGLLHFQIVTSSNFQIHKSSHFQILFLNASFDGIVDYLIDIGSDIEIREFGIVTCRIYSVG